MCLEGIIEYAAECGRCSKSFFSERGPKCCGSRSLLFPVWECFAGVAEELQLDGVSGCWRVRFRKLSANDAVVGLGDVSDIF